MSKNDTYEIWLEDTLRRESDRVVNIHGRYSVENTHMYHIGCEMWFSLRMNVPSDGPSPSPSPEPADPIVDPEHPWEEWDEEGFRDYASNVPNENVAIPYNPMSSIAKAVRSYRGVPLTRESGSKYDEDPTLPRDYKRRFRWMRATFGYIVVPVGVWSETMLVTW